MAVLERARSAAAREDWAGAYRLLHEADRHPAGALTPGDLDVLADSAWWSGRVEESVAARLRAHAAYVAEGDWRGAGLTAWWLSFEYRRLGRPAAAAGWLHRARHQLEGRPDCPEQCFLAWTDTEEADGHHDPAAALAAAHRMTRLALRSGSPDLLALSRHAEASVLLAQGRRAEAFALLDEAMASVTAGELSGLFTGRLYSLALTRCMSAADLRRAVAWTDAAMAWCAAPGNPFRGLCRIHHVEVLDLLGEWARAEEAARLVCQEVFVDSLDTAAAASYAAGEIQRRQGRLEEAARSYGRAYELGRVPQPGLALLRLAQGRADTALAGLRLALDCQSDPAHDLLGRARLLAALTETSLALGDPAAAAEAATGLERLASPDVPLLSAMAATARGSVTLAPAPLRRALSLWLRLRVPYEAAQVRMLLAAADRAAGDEEAARLGLLAARAAFDRLGAVPDSRRAAALLAGRPPRRLPGGLSVREAEVLRLVASGASDRDVARELVISEHTVARHLHSIFAKLAVSSRTAATAYAYANGLA
ncbi:LuxR C-terminal-related transcriptional regulator [Streptomyces sp. NPDC127092]|uniref:LuxR C-terminal-related transcriptional regulator n=1 Tax=Streptomyces sp. NPDC127092 TaxID=3347135 RepID=UPI0036589275